MVFVLTIDGQASRVLEAYTDLLVERGVRGATLEEVSRRCGLSKSGVLHHFRSMDKLRVALFAEAREQAREDVQTMRTAPEGAVRYYLRSSLDRESELERLIEACTRIAQTGDEEALTVLRDSRAGWFEGLSEATGDPDASALILMLGDGVNHNALLRAPEGETFLTDASLDRLVNLVDPSRNSQ
ncbi:TetR/AcrR family transcriptional regulator [Microbacterium sp. NPDC089698]|uniref:TetR/AcrR family transcriptional regulator n=1 Tax=Microbacterium sp. NPDC089698 TaxID=3364200 RepID=UPI00381958EB